VTPLATYIVYRRVEGNIAAAVRSSSGAPVRILLRKKNKPHNYAPYATLCDAGAYRMLMRLRFQLVYRFVSEVTRGCPQTL
jgi:hypothetical protein